MVRHYTLFSILHYWQKLIRFVGRRTQSIWKKNKLIFTLPGWLMTSHIPTITRDLMLYFKCADSYALQLFVEKASCDSIQVAQIGSRHLSAVHYLPFILVTAWVPHSIGHKELKKNMLLHYYHQAIGTFQGFQWAESWKGHAQRHSRSCMNTHLPKHTDWGDFRGGNTQKLIEQTLTKTDRRPDDAKQWNQQLVL